jgi:hypothetical protein
MAGFKIGNDGILLAGGTDIEGTGGLYGLDGSLVERIDRLSSNSLALAGNRLLRLLWSLPGATAHLLVYTDQGIERHFALEDLGDAHQVAFDGANYVLVSTATNSIVWLSPCGARREWKAPGNGDAWHLNSVFSKDGHLFISAFGRFSDASGWRTHARTGTGIVFDLDTGRDVLAGLCCPHHPIWLDGFWVVCNSALHEVLEMDEQGTVRRRVHVGGWSRGIAASDDHLFVGVSAPRHDPDLRDTTASVAVICRRTWALLERVPLPALEIGSLAIAPTRLVDAVRRSAADLDKLELQMLPLEPLPAGSIRLGLLDSPETVESNEEFLLRVSVENLSRIRLQSVTPNPVHLSYHWTDRSGKETIVLDGIRTPLNPPLASGQACVYTMRVMSPKNPGEYMLQVTLVQERVRWFDWPPTNLCSEVKVLVGNARSPADDLWLPSLEHRRQ